MTFILLLLLVAVQISDMQPLGNSHWTPPKVLRPTGRLRTADLHDKGVAFQQPRWRGIAGGTEILVAVEFTELHASADPKQCWRLELLGGQMVSNPIWMGGQKMLESDVSRGR